jgi:16S rRNA (guanine966-N2)-methyltransferase
MYIRCFLHLFRISNLVLRTSFEASNFVLQIYSPGEFFATLRAMRIIAGEFRGRKLLPPEREITRPVTDRVKQSLFDILTPYLEGAIVYDCFAGTGSMGLECLSRGAKQVTFFEADRSAATRLKKNIETLKVTDQTSIVGGDLFKWFTSHANGNADLIFLDPPYRFLKTQPADLLALAARFGQHLNPQGIVIFRHDAADTLALPPLQVADLRTYGSMTLEFLRPQQIKVATNNGQLTTDMK